MNITNVVLDRDKQIVTFDTAKQEDLEEVVCWSEDYNQYCLVVDCEYRVEVEQAISLATKTGGIIKIERVNSSEQEPTPDYYNKTFKGVKLDPYRVCKIYDINGGPREHIVKKLLRGVNKDDGINTELDLISVVEGQLKRWKEMLKEDAE